MVLEAPTSASFELFDNLLVQKRRFSLISSPIATIPNMDLSTLSSIDNCDLKTTPDDVLLKPESLLDVFNDDTPTIVSTEQQQEQQQQQPKKKRRKRATDHKFRPYQAEKWKERYDELILFRKDKGHCLVPHTFPENPPLARWVKRQRYQYKLLQENKQSSMTQERIKILEKIGFIWDSHEAAWEERLKELLEFKSVKGNCLVPSNYPANPQLATWVKCQRRQYKLYWEGRPSNMTVERIMVLERHGFEWELRASSSYSRKNNNNNKIRPPPIHPKQQQLNEPVALDEVESEKLFMDLLSDLSEDDTDGLIPF